MPNIFCNDQKRICIMAKINPSSIIKVFLLLFVSFFYDMVFPSPIPCLGLSKMSRVAPSSSSMQCSAPPSWSNLFGCYLSRTTLLLPLLYSSLRRDEGLGVGVAKISFHWKLKNIYIATATPAITSSWSLLIEAEGDCRSGSLGMEAERLERLY